MKTALCDDSRQFIETVDEYFERILDKRDICDFFESGEEIVKRYEEGTANYDVVFLDMEMKALNGIETANIIRMYDAHVIIVFVTSHREYAPDCFECEPFRFITKPAGFAKFCAVFADIRAKLEKGENTVIFGESKNIVRLFTNEIVYAESRLHSVLIHTVDKKYKFSETMSEIESKLTDSFVRVHKSFILNLSFIKEIKEREIIMYNCTEPIPIGRIYRKTLGSAFIEFKERKFGI